MSRFADKYKLKGMINTIWCPYRYVQDAIYYGIAFGSYSFKRKGKVDLNDFNREFAKKVFCTADDENINWFLKDYSKYNADIVLIGDLFNMKWEHMKLKAPYRLLAVEMNKLGRKLFLKIENCRPKKNKEILDSMVLAVKCAWLLSEHFLIVKNNIKDKSRIKEYKEMLKTVTEQVSDNWDKTRFPDDPQKFGGVFWGEKVQYMSLILKELKKI